MPMSSTFHQRLTPHLEAIVNHFGTPFHIYDEQGIRETGALLKDTFRNFKGFKEFYAVKALPNPQILTLMLEMGFGFDCSSVAELVQARQVGAQWDDLMFTSNNTTQDEFACAFGDGGAIINLDDMTLIDKLPSIPDLICFRYNPGERRDGTSFIGKPVEAKYGVSHDQIIEAYRRVQQMGIQRFGLHTMLVSNELNHEGIIETAHMVLALAGDINRELGICFDFINIGGGLGIPYRPAEAPLDLEALAVGIEVHFKNFDATHHYRPRLFMESGRYITGPHGVLVTRAINEKNIYRRYIGVDACMSSLMRPGMYGAYHHLTVHGKEECATTHPVDVVGSLCENNDKFAIQRELPPIENGDIVLIHDTGAHGHAMGFNYNGRLRPMELLLQSDGKVKMIRRAETLADHFATLSHDADVLAL